MIASDRYSGAHIGVNRQMTPSEIARLRKASEKVANRPPWTPKKMRGTYEFRKTVISLYEDGVSAASIAEALDWQLPRIAQHIRHARLAGLGTGTRRYIAPPDRSGDKAKRSLTPAETEQLLTMFEAIPVGQRDASARTKYEKPQKHWKSREGKALINYIAGLKEDRVPLAEIANLLGLTRAAISLHVANGAKANLSEDGPTRSITREESSALKKMYNALDIGYTGAKKWTDERGLVLIDEIRKLVSDGVPVSTTHVGKRVQYRGIDSALGIPPSAIGRMVAMRDSIAERL